MSLSSDFRELRRVATPWCVVKTTDYRATIKELLKVRVNGEVDPNAYVWDCVNGARTISGETCDLGDKDTPPSQVLSMALNMSAESILFFVVPDSFEGSNSTWTNPFTVQAASNLRDPFKGDRRILVILSVDAKLPALIVDDVPVLEDPLPTLDELKVIAKDISGIAKAKVDDDTLSKGAQLCLGMTRFAAEEAVSRKVSKANGMNLDGLALAQRTQIEQSSERGLTFERGSETFTDIGGLDQIKKFSTRLFSGERPPTVIVRIEEIEKSMAGVGSSGLGDSSGVSQDQLGVLLTCMEDFEWTGLIAVGPAGSGKSLISKAMGNTNKVPTVNLDLGALKGSFVGQSEGKIRKAMTILKSFAGNGAFFVATSNGLSIIPPELRRRFRYGIWYFNLLSAEERKAVWKINLKRFGLDAKQPMPIDTDWTGSDIRNVCDLAFRLRCPLTEAAEFIVPVAKSDPGAVTRLQDAANGRFLDASNPGPYIKQGAEKQGRAMVI